MVMAGLGKHALESGSKPPKLYRACIASLQHTHSLTALHCMGMQVSKNMRWSWGPNPEVAFTIHSVSELCTVWTWKQGKCARVGV